MPRVDTTPEALTGTPSADVPVKAYRCYNPKCADKPDIPGHDFLAAAAACDRCGIKAADPRFGRFLTELVLIHYEPPSGVVDGIGADHVACLPERPAGGLRRTGAPSAVTCPACRGTDAWKRDSTPAAVKPEDDLTLTIDPATGVVTATPCGC